MVRSAKVFFIKLPETNVTLALIGCNSNPIISRQNEAYIRLLVKEWRPGLTMSEIVSVFKMLKMTQKYCHPS